MSWKPLRGVRVLDLSHTLAGPFATMVLADLGAEVVKIEPPGGDETRSWAPFVDGESAYFMSINRGKKSVVVNLKDPRGREIIYRLARRSHVVIENFRPGVAERLGVDYSTISRVNPGVVYVSIKGFGSIFFFKQKTAYEIVIQGMSGLMATTGEEGRPPVRVSFALFDVITGLLAAVYTLAALRSGERPIHVEVSMYDAAVFSMCYVPMIYLLTGRKPPRMGSAHPSIVPYQAFRGSDGRWFIVAAANDRLWRALCRAIGLEELADDPRFRTNADRVRNRGELVPILEKVFSEKPRSYWLELLEKAGVPAAPVYELDEVFRDPHIASSGLVVRVRHPKLGEVPQLAEPAEVKGSRPFAEQPPPLLGQHTEEVLRELGYTPEEIEELRRSGVIA